MLNADGGVLNAEFNFLQLKCLHCICVSLGITQIRSNSSETRSFESCKDFGGNKRRKGEAKAQRLPEVSLPIKLEYIMGSIVQNLSPNSQNRNSIV